MAIKKFVQAQTYDQTAFGAWLNANKEGTFLENMTITVDDWNGTNDRLTIDNGSEYMIYYAEQSKVDITYFYIRS